MDFSALDREKSFLYNRPEVISMLFDGNNPVTEICDATHLTWDCGSFHVKARPYCALAWRKEGEGTFEFPNGPLTVKANDVLYLPQNMPYIAEYTPTDLWVIHFRTLYDDAIPAVFSARSLPAAACFEQAQTLWRHKAPGVQAQVMSLLYRLIADLSVPQKADSAFESAVADLQQRFSEVDFSVSDLCRKHGLSETAFRTRFKERYHQLPIDFLTDLRLEAARRRIARGESIALAAKESGFADPKYFSRVVRRRCGISPKQWRFYGR